MGPNVAAKPLLAPSHACQLWRAHPAVAVVYVMVCHPTHVASQPLLAPIHKKAHLVVARHVGVKLQGEVLVGRLDVVDGGGPAAAAWWEGVDGGFVQRRDRARARRLLIRVGSGRGQYFHGP